VSSYQVTRPASIGLRRVTQAAALACLPELTLAGARPASSLFGIRRFGSFVTATLPRSLELPRGRRSLPWHTCDCYCYCSALLCSARHRSVGSDDASRHATHADGGRVRSSVPATYAERHVHDLLPRRRECNFARDGAYAWSGFADHLTAGLPMRLLGSRGTCRHCKSCTAINLPS
jgi:hypothetical protein